MTYIYYIYIVFIIYYIYLIYNNILNVTIKTQWILDLLYVYPEVFPHRQPGLTTGQYQRLTCSVQLEQDTTCDIMTAVNILLYNKFRYLLFTFLQVYKK